MRGNTVLIDGDEIREVFRNDGMANGYDLDGRRYNAERILNLFDNRKFGLGITLDSLDLGYLVTSVIPVSPANNGNMRSGDIIIAIEGENITGLDFKNFLDSLLGENG